MKRVYWIFNRFHDLPNGVRRLEGSEYFLTFEDIRKNGYKFNSKTSY